MSKVKTLSPENLLTYLKDKVPNFVRLINDTNGICQIYSNIDSTILIPSDEACKEIYQNLSKRNIESKEIENYVKSYVGIHTIRENLSDPAAFERYKKNNEELTASGFLKYEVKNVVGDVITLQPIYNKFVKGSVKNNPIKIEFMQSILVKPLMTKGSYIHFYKITDGAVNLNEKNITGGYIEKYTMDLLSDIEKSNTIEEPVTGGNNQVAPSRPPQDSRFLKVKAMSTLKVKLDKLMNSKTSGSIRAKCLEEFLKLIPVNVQGDERKFRYIKCIRVVNSFFIYVQAKYEDTFKQLLKSVSLNPITTFCVILLNENSPASSQMLEDWWFKEYKDCYDDYNIWVNRIYKLAIHEWMTSLKISDESGLGEKINSINKLKLTNNILKEQNYLAKVKSIYTDTFGTVVVDINQKIWEDQVRWVCDLAFDDATNVEILFSKNPVYDIKSCNMFTPSRGDQCNLCVLIPNPNTLGDSPSCAEYYSWILSTYSMYIPAPTEFSSFSFEAHDFNKLDPKSISNGYIHIEKKFMQYAQNLIAWKNGKETINVADFLTRTKLESDSYSSSSAVTDTMPSQNDSVTERPTSASASASASGSRVRVHNNHDFINI